MLSTLKSIGNAEKFIALIVGLLLFALPVFSLAADTKGPLTANLTLKLVQFDTEGKETLIDTTSVKPGDIVEYQVVYANVSKKALGNVQANLPIPTDMEYQADSARPVPVEASTDGKEFSTVPLQRQVTDEKGKVVSKPVPLAEYRVLRWQIPVLEPGTDIIVKARVRVRGNPKVPGAAEVLSPGASTKK